MAGRFGETWDAALRALRNHLNEYTPAGLTLPSSFVELLQALSLNQSIPQLSVVGHHSDEFRWNEQGEAHGRVPVGQQMTLADQTRARTAQQAATKAHISQAEHFVTALVKSAATAVKESVDRTCNVGAIAQRYQRDWGIPPGEVLLIVRRHLGPILGGNDESKLPSTTFRLLVQLCRLPSNGMCVIEGGKVASTTRFSYRPAEISSSPHCASASGPGAASGAGADVGADAGFSPPNDRQQSDVTMARGETLAGRIPLEM